MELLEKNKPYQATKHLEMQNQPLSFPKVCNADPNRRNITCLQQYMMKNEENIISDLKKQGAILFRGYDIKSPNQSVAALKHMNFTDFGCCENKLKIIVGTKEKQLLNTEPLTMFACQSSTDMQHANIHNQFCQTNECPQFVALFCFKAAIKGGNISLINWRELSKYVDEKHPQFLHDIKSKGIAQITVLSQHQNPQHRIGNGWKNSFKVANKEEAQKVFKQNKYEFQWLDNKTNDCRLMKIKKGPQLYNILNEIISLYKNCEYSKSDIKNFLTFGDGQKMPQDVLDDICQSAQKYVSEIQMREQCDLMIINYQMLKYIHCPFEGPEQLRKYYVSFMRHQSKKQKCTQLYQILNTGYKLPLIGFGTWKIKKEQAEEVVYNAIKSGYRLIDCAPVYQNQKQVGKGIKKALKQKIVKREDLFITSKLWNTNHRPENVRPAVQSNLKNMGLEYLDLLLMHFPVSLRYRPIDQQKYPEWIYDQKSDKPYMLQQKVPVTETWKALQDLTVAKLVRNIGLSNCPVALIRQVINTCQIKPEVLQNEIHPQLSERNLIRYARQEGIQVTSYSSFGASSYYEIGFAKQKDDQPTYKNEAVIKIGKKHNRSPHQVILRWVIQQGIAVIPKSVKPQRMKQNSDITEFSLDKQDMEQIQKLNRHRRYNDPGQFCQGGFGKFYPLFQ